MDRFGCKRSAKPHLNLTFVLLVERQADRVFVVVDNRRKPCTWLNAHVGTDSSSPSRTSARWRSYSASAGSARIRDRTGRKLLREVVIRKSRLSGWVTASWF